MSDQSEDLGDAILSDRAHGQSVRAIARARGLTVPEVERLLDEAASRLLSGVELRRELAAEAVRLSDLKQVFFGQGRTGDVASGAVYAKLSERLATMLGMNAPLAHAVTLATAAAPIAQTSTERYRAILDRLMGKPEEQEDESGSRTDGQKHGQTATSRHRARTIAMA
jgi:hypothetical protein